MARFSPRPMPVPMSADPPACMTVRTSAKSTFTRPVTLMSDEMPCVACSSTSSAFLSASWNGMPLPTTASSRSFGTTIIVSTFLRMSAMPCSAWRMRLRPSKRNGFVTMPTVSAPASRASSAMTGAAPVPVPPPMPHVMKTRSALRQRAADFVAILFDRLTADLRARAGAESARELLPDLDFDVGLGRQQRLRVGVDRDELDAFEMLVDHAVDGVSAAAADAHDLHAGVLGRALFELEDH